MADPTLVAWFADVHAAVIHNLPDYALAHKVAQDAALPPSPLANAVRRLDEAELRRRAVLVGGVR